MNLKTIFWPWGRIAELKSQLEDYEADFVELDEELDATEEALDFMAYVAQATALDATAALIALHDIVAAADKVATPNGTTKKLSRMASDALASLTVNPTPEQLDNMRANLAVLREIDAEIAEKEAAEAAAAPAEEFEPA